MKTYRPTRVQDPLIQRNLNEIAAVITDLQGPDPTQENLPVFVQRQILVQELSLGTETGVLRANMGVVHAVPQVAALDGGTGQDSTLWSGVPHVAAGVWSAGAVVNADIDAAAAIAWSKVSKAGSNLNELTTRDHTVLTSVGTNTHAQLDTHLADVSGAVHGATAANTNNMIVRRDGSGQINVTNVYASGDVTAQGYVQAVSHFYSRANYYLLNKAGNNWVALGSRDTSGPEVVYNLANIGTIQTSGNATFASSVIQGASDNGPHGSIRSRGSEAALYFDDRSNNSNSFAWYAIGGVAKLYGSSDLLSIDTAGNITAIGDLIGTTAKSIRNTFTSGQFGQGYRLDHNSSISGQSFMEIDNLVVRGAMRVNVFEKGVIKAVNGGVYISSAASTVAFDQATGGQFSFVAQDNAFVENDILQYKDVTITGGLVVVSVMFKVLLQSDVDVDFPGNTQGQAVTGGYQFFCNTQSGSGTMRAGGTVVQVGNLTNTTRQAGLFLTANDGSSNVPYIDVYNGRTGVSTVTPKARLGNLAGITDPTFGTLVGYGLYSQNVYLTGNAQVAGTLTAGYGSAVGATFYAGKIAVNLLKYHSEDYSSGWSIFNGLTFTANITTDPQGVPSSADRMVSSGTYGGLASNGSNAQCQTNTFTYSVFLKGESGGESAQLNLVRSGDNVIANFVDITITNGWERYSVTGTFNGTNPTQEPYTMLYVVSASATVYVWGSQLELGSITTSYQRTDGSLYSGSDPFGMWAVAGGFGGTIQNPTVQLGNYGMKVTSGGVATALAASSIMIGNVTGTANSALKLTNTGTSGTSGLFGYTGAGAESFALRLDGSAQIAGWAFDDAKIYKSNAVLSSTGYVSFGSTPPSAYGNNVGAWLGDVSGTAKLSLYASASSFMQWDGSALSMGGATLTAGVFRTDVVGQPRVELSNSIGGLNFVHAASGSDVANFTVKPHYDGSSPWLHVNVVSSAATGVWVGPSSSSSTGWGKAWVAPLVIRLYYMNNTTELSRIGLSVGANPGLMISTSGSDVQVVGLRRTGWGTNTGTKYRGNLSDSSTQAEVNRAVFAILEDMTSHGLVGA